MIGYKTLKKVSLLKSIGIGIAIYIFSACFDVLAYCLLILSNLIKSYHDPEKTKALNGVELMF